MSKTTVIAFANNKGGSGKTTTCSNVGCAMALMGKKVLLIDGDMQLNLTISYFDEDTALGYAQDGKTLYTALKEEKDLSEFIVETGIDGLDIVPSSSLMSSIEFDLFSKWQRELVLTKCLERVRAKGYYDYILIDAPPTLGGWVMNIMCAADYLVIPVEASPWGLFGLANMFDFCDQVKRISPKLEILGIAITKADERKKYFKQTLETLQGLEAAALFQTYVRVDSAVEWAQDSSKPVVAFKKTSRSAVEYTNLTKEIMENVNRKERN
ncbi:MAG: ParA family protein [Clostridia bacterium]|nr:ParA family protein [Clostridia bacterium]